MEPPDISYAVLELAQDARYGDGFGASKIAKTLAAYDRVDPGATKTMRVASSDYVRLSEKLFWPEKIMHVLPVAEVNLIMSFVVAIKPKLLLFVGMKDHLHAAGLLEPLRNQDTNLNNLGSI